MSLFLFSPLLLLNLANFSHSVFVLEIRLYFIYCNRFDANLIRRLPQELHFPFSFLSCYARSGFFFSPLSPGLL